MSSDDRSPVPAYAEDVSSPREVSSFEALGCNVRFGETSHGVPFAVAADFARVMDYRDAANAIRILDPDERGTQIVSTPGGDQRVSVIYEDGIWELIFRSSKPEAKTLKRRVKAILAEIRRTGRFVPAQRQPAIPQSYAEALRAAAEQAEAAERLAIENAALKPAAHAWTELASAEGDYLVADAAKVLSRDPQISIGQNNLFKLMADLGWVFKRGRRDSWHASQRQIGLDRLAERAQTYTDPDGLRQTATPQVRVTAKGIAELHRRLGGSEPVDFTATDAPAGQLELTGGI